MFGKTRGGHCFAAEITKMRSALVPTSEVALCGGSKLSGRRDSAKLSALSQLQCNRSLASSCGGKHVKIRVFSWADGYGTGGGDGCVPGRGGERK
jgi:hypothetical protein